MATSVALIREGRLVVTDTIANLQHQAPMRVTFEFAAPVDRDEFRGLPGVQAVEVDGNRVDLAMSGSIDAVVKDAARHETFSLTAWSARSRGHLFLGYYEVAPR